MDSTFNLATDFDWFEDFDIETNPLYSNSLASSTSDKENETLIDRTERSPDEENQLSSSGLVAPLEELFTLTEEFDVPLTKTITVGNPERTQFTFNFAEDTLQEVIDGVKQAGENWSSVLKDDVELTIDFNFQSIDGIFGQTTPQFLSLDYSAVQEALTQDITSSNDQTVVTNLPEETVSYLINNTAENGGSDIPYLDDDNSFNNLNINITTANAKALGYEIEDIAILPDLTLEDAVNMPDANIVFNSDFNWDYDRSDGIAADAYDFVGIVAHELGHGLGFFSNAAFLDNVNGTSIKKVIEQLDPEEIQELGAGSDLVSVADSTSADQLFSENEYLPTTLDLFRFSPESFAQDARDFTTSSINDKYFSIDSGKTEIAPMTEAFGFSHWQESLGIGLMNPTFRLGQLEEISDTDLLAFDTIGWNVA